MKKYFVFIIFLALIPALSFAQDLKLKDLNFKKASSFLINKNLIEQKYRSKINELNINNKKYPVVTTNFYLWLMTLDGSAAVPLNKPGLPVVTPTTNINLKFSDAIKYLKFAAMAAGSVMFKNLSFLYDVTYVKLRYDGAVTGSQKYKRSTLSSEMFIGDINVAYHVDLKRKKAQNDFYIGARVWSLDNTIDLSGDSVQTVTAGASRTWVDPLVGVSTIYNFSAKWFSYTKAEIGGFGISSKISYLLLVTAGYKFTPHWNTIAGFKFLKTDYNKDNFLWKMSQYGFLLSLGYQF